MRVDWIESYERDDPSASGKQVKLCLRHDYSSDEFLTIEELIELRNHIDMFLFSEALKGKHHE